MQRVNVSDLLSKLKTKEDKINFMREAGYILPNERGFDTKFFLQALKGEKTLLRIGQYGGVDFPYFTKSNHFTKNYLLSFFKNDPTLRNYLPDDIRMEFIKRSYLLNILFVAKREIYNKLYMEYKIIKNSRETTKWNSYYVNVTTQVANGINQYTSLGGNKKNGHSFRITKKGQNLNVFGKLNEEEIMEVKIPKEGYNPFSENENNHIINLEEYEGNEQGINIIHSNIIKNMKEEMK